MIRPAIEALPEVGTPILNAAQRLDQQQAMMYQCRDTQDRQVAEFRTEMLAYWGNGDLQAFDRELIAQAEHDLAIAQERVNVARRAYIAAHATHRIGDDIAGNRSMSGQTCRMIVDSIHVSISDRLTLIQYTGRALTKDGAATRIAAYHHETHSNPVDDAIRAECNRPVPFGC
jgi:hypothetical protein